MDYKVDFVTQTERDLFSITQFLAEKNPAAAQHLGDALIDAALSLGSLPRRGGLVIGRPGVLKLGHLPYHVIFYRISPRLPTAAQSNSPPRPMNINRT